ncbi:hypothetical protein OAC63_05220 [Amylibacter sp.]|jgi:hypothetical protein|nr:hypothetical protein [Amylibacter sp.]
MANTDGGFFEGTSYSNKTFYGFKLNKEGDLNVEIINDGTTIVRLPEDDIIDDNDYKQWFWSSDTLDFYFDGNGHLIMKMI